MQEEVGLRAATDGEFRRTSWHMDFIYQLGGIDPTDEKLTVHFRNEQGELDFESAALSVHEPVSLPRHDLRRRVRVPARHGDDRRTEDHHPVAEHGALPRRPGGDRSGGLPGPRAVLGRPDRRVRRTGARARRPRLHVPPAGRHEPGVPQRPRAARDDRGARRRRRAPARAVHPRDQRRARRPSGRACTSPPTCAAATSARPGRPRGRTTSSPRRCSRSWTWTASSWSTTTRGPAASSRCGSCRRARPSCSAWSPPSAARSRTRTPSSGASTRPAATCPWSSCACRRSAGSPRPSRATP